MSSRTIEHDHAEFQAWLKENPDWPAHDPRTREFFDEMQREQGAYAGIVVPPCPAWCTSEAPHEYDSYNEGPEGFEFARFHWAAFGALVRIQQLESNLANRVTTRPPVICVEDKEDLDVVAGAQLARDLDAAVAKLSEITAVSA